MGGNNIDRAAESYNLTLAAGNYVFRVVGLSSGGTQQTIATGPLQVGSGEHLFSFNGNEIERGWDVV